MRSFGIASALSLMLITPAVAAEANFEYTYIEVTYRDHSFNRYDGDGFGIEGAYAFGTNYFLFARMTKDTADTSFQMTGLYPEPPPSTGMDFLNRDVTVDAKLEDFIVGAGITWPLSDTVDVSGKVFFWTIDGSERVSGTYEIVNESGEVQSSGPLCSIAVCTPDEFDDSGLGLEASIRGAVTDWFELFGSVAYIDVDPGEELSIYQYEGSITDTALAIGARFAATERLSLSLSAAKRDEFDSMQLGARYTF